MFNYSEEFVGAHAGWLVENDRVQMDLVAEGGVHWFSDLGRDFLQETDAPTAKLPYVGARWGVLCRPGAGSGRLGLWVFARADVGRSTVIANTNAFTDHDTYRYEIGGYTAGLAVRVGFGGQLSAH
ncbi:MAG: hypothetical protein ABJA82_05925 [Myxococcales bacterium]